MNVRAGDVFFQGFGGLSRIRSYPRDPFHVFASAKGRIKEDRVAGRRTLTILKITSAIIRRIPIRTVHSSISQVTTVAALPVLRTIQDVIRMTFALIFDHFFASKVRFSEHRFIHVSVRSIRSVNGMDQSGRLIAIRSRVTEAIPLRQSAFTRTVRRDRIMIRRHLVKVIRRFLRRHLVIGRTSLIHSQVKSRGELIITNGTPSANHAPFKFVRSSNSRRLLLISVSRTGDAHIRPSLLRLEYESNRAPRIIQCVCVFTIKDCASSPGNVTSIYRLSILRLHRTVRFSSKCANNRVVRVDPLYEGRIHSRRVFTILTRRNKLQFTRCLRHARRLPHGQVSFKGHNLRLIACVCVLLIQARRQVAYSQANQGEDLRPTQFRQRSLWVTYHSRYDRVYLITVRGSAHEHFIRQREARRYLTVEQGGVRPLCSFVYRRRLAFNIHRSVYQRRQ